jgi:hypothetical protein
MSCDRYRSAITDHACGGELAAGAAAHLRSCASCAAILEDERRAIGALDRELQEAIAIQPSAHFVQRVQVRARQAPAPTPRLWWALAAAAALAVAAIAGGLALRSGDRQKPPVVIETASPTPSIARTLESVDPKAPANPTQLRPGRLARGPDAPRSHQLPRAPRSQRVLAGKPAPKPEVIVPPGQRRGVERYMMLVRSGQLNTSPLTDETATTASEIVVAPLAVDSLAVATIETRSPAGGDAGVRNEGAQR